MQARGCKPEDWRVTTVIPMVYKGNMDNPGKYRPFILIKVLRVHLETLTQNRINSRQE